MKILILVLSYDVGVYRALMAAQQNSWDEVSEEDVRTVYYMGDTSLPHFNRADVFHRIIRQGHKSSSHELCFNCTDEYYRMSEKFQKALEYVKDWDYDIIFRTNSSSYVNKKRLKEFAATLPKEKLYAGWTFVDSEDFGGACVSGAGVFITKDCAEILRNEIDPEKEIEEDVYLGRILRKHGIEAIDDKSRYDVPENVPDDMPLDLYHYRCKCGLPREVDAANMRLVHQKIIQ